MIVLFLVVVVLVVLDDGGLYGLSFPGLRRLLPMVYGGIRISKNEDEESIGRRMSGGLCDSFR